MFPTPKTDKRIGVIGRTGSGKSVLASHLLSISPFDRQPYVIVDYKGEAMFRELSLSGQVPEIGLNELPRRKDHGLYIIRPEPDDDEEMEAWMRRVWAQENVGLYFDELTMVPQVRGRHKSLRSILTQGRSKHIPVIGNTQRPVDVTKFMFSEADYLACFELITPEDQKRVSAYMGSGVPIHERQPDYHSWWFDVGTNTAYRLKPAPNPDSIVERILHRLPPRRRMI